MLLGLNGLRVSEACETNIDDVGMERGYRVLRIVGKGHQPALIPLVPRPLGNSEASALSSHHLWALVSSGFGTRTAVVGTLLIGDAVLVG